MIPVGEFSNLTVMALGKEGATLGKGGEEVLLPARVVPEGLVVGRAVWVFVYSDANRGLVATTETPRAAVGEFAYLPVVEVTEHGAFLDWGLDKDLFVPKSKQQEPMARGRSYVVAVYVDERTGRVTASSKLGSFFDYELGELRDGQEVSLLVYGENELGAHVVVDGRYRGLVHQSDIFRPLATGDALTGFIRAIRPDNKLDIVLSRVGREAAEDARDVLCAALEKANGALQLSDKSSPEDVYETLGISKKAFKRAVGQLYKARRIDFDNEKIWLVAPGPSSER